MSIIVERPFSQSVLYVYLDSISLKSSVEVLDIGELVDNFEGRTYIKPTKPYAFFLNEYLDADKQKLVDLAHRAEKAICENVSGVRDQDFINNLYALKYESENIFEKHVISTLLGNYLAAFSAEEIHRPASQKLISFKASYEDMFIEKYSLQEIFAAYDIMPFYAIDSERKKDILMSWDYGIYKMIARNQMISAISPIIQYFIILMQSNNLYLQQCNTCGKLFVRTTKRKSAFCQGAYCEKNPEWDAYSRYMQKQKVFQYLKVYNDVRVYFNQRVSRGNMKDEERQAFQEEAKKQKRKVETGLLSENDFIVWLIEHKKNAIEDLKKAKEK